MKRKSKYVGKIFDNGWKCTHIGIACVQSAKNKYAYHQTYYYLMERETSDHKFVKQVRVPAGVMAKIARGQILADTYADKVAMRYSNKPTSRVGYAFKKQK